MDKPAAVISVPAVEDQGALSSRLAPGKRRRFKQNNLAGYLFVSPWLIGFLLFTMIPMAISLVLAFTDYDILNNVYTPEFVQPVLYGQVSVEDGVATLRKGAEEILAKNKKS